MKNQCPLKLQCHYLRISIMQGIGEFIELVVFSMMNLPTLPDQTVKQTSTLTLKKPLKVPVQRKSAVLNPKLLP